MLFSSLTFLYFFLPIVLILYFVINNRTWRNSVLLVSSLVFYSWGEPKYVFLMLASTLVAWLCGLGIDRFKEKRRISRAFLIASLVLLLGSLAVFKYLNFFVENLNRIDGVALKVRNIALPIGISFYTFQILSYLIDLYWEKVSVQKSYFRFTLYVCLFPQLIAGPIVRYETVEREISLRRESWEEAVGGMRRFILGLAKRCSLRTTSPQLRSISIRRAARGAEPIGWPPYATRFRYTSISPVTATWPLALAAYSASTSLKTSTTRTSPAPLRSSGGAGT